MVTSVSTTPLTATQRNIFLAAVFVISTLYFSLGVFSRQEEGSLLVFYGLSAMTLITIGVFFRYLETEKIIFPVKYLIISVIIIRVIGIYGVPLYEDDYYRYLWDGYLFYHYGTPYGIPPSDHFLNTDLPGIFQHIIGLINNPDIPTIYGPTLQYSFLLAYLFAPGNVIALQILYSFIDIALILILLTLSTPNRVLLYAWSPLVVKEIIFTAHPDIVGVMLLMAALFFFVRHLKNYAVIFLSLSVCAKIFAWLFVPFILFYCTNKQRALFFAVVAALYFPFIGFNGSDFIGLLSFARDFEFNSALYSLATYLMPGIYAKAFCAGIFLVFYGIYFRHYLRTYKPGNPAIPRGDWILGAFLLCAPVINAWYLIWLLPFGVIFRGTWVWVASASVLLTYVTGLQLNDVQMGSYDLAWWVVPVEFGVIGLAVLYDVRHKKKVNDIVE
ncbi:MAG: hypothetical protein COB30_021010 [Ectothiorhodospiraceae bacterium]|nr:hypothetical protein [Ectothiorhodospiraceae bacterium]